MVSSLSIVMSFHSSLTNKNTKLKLYLCCEYDDYAAAL